MFLLDVIEINRTVVSIVENVEKTFLFNRNGEPVLVLIGGWLVNMKRDRVGFFKKGNIWSVDRTFLGSYLNGLFVGTDGKIIARERGVKLSPPSVKPIPPSRPVLPRKMNIPKFTRPESIPSVPNRRKFSDLEL